MGDPVRQWQATIQLDENNERNITVYGETLPALREAAKAWVKENNPTFVRIRTKTFFYSDGTYIAITNPVLHKKEKLLEEGWYAEESLHSDGGFFDPHYVAIPVNTVPELIGNALIPEKGPDYRDIAIVNGILQPHLIKTICRETDENKTNELVKRGWHIISIGFYGTEDYFGKEVKSRTPLYVLGHPEEDAV